MCITLFSITISAATVIKATNIKNITPPIFHKKPQTNIQSSAQKLVKLSYLVSSVDKKYVNTAVPCVIYKKP